MKACSYLSKWSFKCTVGLHQVIVSLRLKEIWGILNTHTRYKYWLGLGVICSRVGPTSISDLTCSLLNITGVGLILLKWRIEDMFDSETSKVKVLDYNHLFRPKTLFITSNRIGLSVNSSPEFYYFVSTSVYVPLNLHYSRSRLYLIYQNLPAYRVGTHLLLQLLTEHDAICFSECDE